jgi:hypothetical protein
MRLHGRTLNGDYPMTRHQRRKLARKRADANAAKLLSRALHVLKVEKAKQSLASPYKGKRTPSGLVSSIYSGAANPLGYTRPLTFSKGEAK